MPCTLIKEAVHTNESAFYMGACYTLAAEPQPIIYRLRMGGGGERGEGHRSFTRLLPTFVVLVFDFYVFNISRAQFFASLKQIPKVTTTFLLCVKYCSKINAKHQVYNNQALLMQHLFTHDNLISMQNYCQLSRRF